MSKKINVKILSLFIIIFIFNSYFSVFASESELSNDDVVVNCDIDNIPNDIIQDIIEDNPDASEITIHDYQEFPDTVILEDNMSEMPIGPVARNAGLWYSYGKVSTTKTTSSEYECKNEFKFSVAKGQKVTLKQEYKGSLKGSYTGIPISVGNLGVNIEITGKYSKGTTYSGPPESSRYNSRRFSMKFYAVKGSYTQTQKVYKYFDAKLLSTSTNKKTGTYEKPTRYASYSVDSSIR
ncbi:hypothetical protein [Robinsoniella peoriensis]